MITRAPYNARPDTMTHLFLPSGCACEVISNPTNGYVAVAWMDGPITVEDVNNLRQTHPSGYAYTAQHDSYD